MSSTKDEIVAVLRRKKIKLWKPPYCCGNDQNTPNLKTLQKLADDLKKEINNNNSNDMTNLIEILLNLQENALEKLAAKENSGKKKDFSPLYCIEMRVLGIQNNLPISSEETPTWTERVEIEKETIRFFNVNPTITINQFEKDLPTLLDLNTFRLIHKGKHISSKNNIGMKLGNILQQSNNGTNKPHYSILCLAFNNDDDKDQSDDRNLLSSIREAASKLGNNSKFELTDQHGKHVPMLPSEYIDFLTALGLHRLGKERLQCGDGDDNDNKKLSSSLTFLLEADQVWENISPQWRNKVDNYGLLQLDISWAYLKLESLDNLSDATRRLELAEIVLRKQVHSNFVTLALVQADMGNAVPPLSSVFCRLFLLQGLAYKFSKHDSEKKKERMGWAWKLCQSLRSVSSDEQIKLLCEAFPSISKAQTISALRRTNGNLDQAGVMIQEDKDNVTLQEDRRTQQRKFGLCENTKDYVNLDLIPQVKSIFDFEFTPIHEQLQELGVVSRDVQSLAVGLLRLNNNDINKVIDCYEKAERSPNAIDQMVADLDQSLYNKGLLSSTRKRKTIDESFTVDQIALVSLISMGVDELIAKKALKHSKNNIEIALLWLTNDNNQSEEQNSKGNNHDDSLIEGMINDHLENLNQTKTISNKTNKMREIKDAEAFLEKELSEVLGEHDLEKEYYGSTLDEEFFFLQKFQERKET